MELEVHVHKDYVMKIEENMISIPYYPNLFRLWFTLCEKKNIRKYTKCIQVGFLTENFFI